MSSALANLLPLVIMGLLPIPPFWKIFTRSGWHPAVSLLMLIPLINLILLWVVAFKKWPADDISGAFN